MLYSNSFKSFRFSYDLKRMFSFLYIIIIIIDITVESLSVFEIAYPTIEVLFIGCGEILKNRFPIHIEKYFRDKGIKSIYFICVS